MADGPIVAVVGGNRRIGAETCRQLAACGQVVAALQRDPLDSWPKSQFFHDRLQISCGSLAKGSIHEAAQI